MKNNSLTYSVNVWLLSILLVPIIATWYGFAISKNSNPENFLSIFLLSPLLIGALTIPLHVIFVFFNNLIFKKIKNERILRLLINLFGVIIGLPMLLFTMGAQFYTLINSTFFFILFDIFLISLLVWTTKIERDSFKEANTPEETFKSGRPDILDDEAFQRTNLLN